MITKLDILHDWMVDKRDVLSSRIYWCTGYQGERYVE